MIPDYQSVMLPLLKLVSDGEEYQYRTIIEKLVLHFNITEEERKKLLNSGRQSVFENRIGWARTYLKKAGLLQSPKRAHFSITDRGLKALSDNQSQGVVIDTKYLRQFPEFLEFQNPSETDDFDTKQIILNTSVSEETPEEILDRAYSNIRKALASDLLAKVIESSPAFFERLVVELLVKMGYGGSIKDAGNAIGRSGDEGIDGTIKEDKLGLDIIYIQAKRWSIGNNVGRPDLQKFVGALAGQGAKKGIFITTSSFSKEAFEYTPRNETKIVLIGGEQLAQLMIDYGIGCTAHQLYELKRLDSDYFSEE